MTHSTTTFAFKLAQRQPKAAGTWKVRPGVTAQGCTKMNDEFGNYAEDRDVWGNYVGRDRGLIC